MGKDVETLKPNVWSYLSVPFFVLQNYPGGEPRNRPSTYGNLSFGKVIGSVSVSGRPPKSIYATIAII